MRELEICVISAQSNPHNHPSKNIGGAKTLALNFVIRRLIKRLFSGCFKTHRAPTNTIQTNANKLVANELRRKEAAMEGRVETSIPWAIWHINSASIHVDSIGCSWRRCWNDALQCKCRYADRISVNIASLLRHLQSKHKNLPCFAKAAVIISFDRWWTVWNVSFWYFYMEMSPLFFTLHSIELHQTFN